MGHIPPYPGVDTEIANVATHPVIETPNLLARLRRISNDLERLSSNRIGDFGLWPRTGLIRATQILPTGKARGREAWGKV